MSELEDLLRERKLIFVLEIVKIGKWTEEEIVSILVSLYKQKKVQFNQEGWTFGENITIYGGISTWTEEDWEKADRKEQPWYGYLCSNYRYGNKRKELLTMNCVMSCLSKSLGIDPFWSLIRYVGKKE